jgi:hypothetical protein
MTTEVHELLIDPSRTPFSRYGAYLAITGDEGGKALTIHNVRRRFGGDRAFTCSFEKDAKPVEWTASARPWELNIESSEGSCRFAIIADDTVMVASDGLELVLRLVDENGYGTENADGSYEIISVPGRFYSQIQVLRGSGILDGPVRPFHGNPVGLGEGAYERRLEPSLRLPEVGHDCLIPLLVRHDHHPLTASRYRSAIA